MIEIHCGYCDDLAERNGVSGELWNGEELICDCCICAEVELI